MTDKKTELRKEEVVSDSTEGKRVEDALQRSEKLFRSVAAAARDAIIIIDDKGIISFWNRAAELIFGWSEGEALGRGLHVIIAPERYREDSDRGLQIFQSTGKGKAVDAILELDALHKDGREFPVELSLAGFKFDNSWHAVGVVRDISERKKAEKDLRKSEADRREQEAFRLANAYNRSLIEASLDPLVTIGPDGKITDVNKATEDATGYPRQKLIGTDFSSYFSVPERAQEGYQLVFHDGLVRDFELELCHRNGSLTPVIYNASIYKDENGEIVGVFAAARDITERKRAEEALHVAVATAEAANRAKSSFLANMSHEIRTPMNGVLGMTGLLWGTPLTDGQRRYAEKIKTSSETLLTVISGILDFSKIDAGKMTLENIPFSLTAVIGNAVSIFGPQAAGKGIDLQTAIDPELPADLRGDPLRLTQVINNLVGNAVKFTVTGDIQLAAKVRRRTPASVELEISVRDTGIGMTEKELSRLYTAFSQADASTTRRFGGTGLGLAISRQLVELMGGTIRAESIPGKGSVFTVLISFPVAIQAPEAIINSNPMSIPPPGLDVEAGLSRLDGNRELYLKLLEDFITGYGEAPGQLLQELRTDRREEVVRRVQAIKGMAGNIGGKDLETAAAELEKACLAAGNGVPFALGETLRVFIDRHEALITAIGVVLARQPVVAPAMPEGPPWDEAEMRLLLARLRKALVSEEPRPCKKIMGELMKKRWPAGREAVLAELSRLVQRYRLVEALALLDKEFDDITGRTEKREND